MTHRTGEMSAIHILTGFPILNAWRALAPQRQTSQLKQANALETRFSQGTFKRPVAPEMLTASGREMHIRTTNPAHSLRNGCNFKQQTVRRAGTPGGLGTLPPCMGDDTASWDKSGGSSGTESHPTVGHPAARLPGTGLRTLSRGVALPVLECCSEQQRSHSPPSASTLQPPTR